MEGQEIDVSKSEAIGSLRWFVVAVVGIIQGSRSMYRNRNQTPCKRGLEAWRGPGAPMSF
jgi:hypothetical protein